MAWFKRKADPPPPGPAPEAGDPSAPEARRGVFARLKQRLSKTRRSFADGVGRILTGKRKIDAEVLDQIEELLITADVGVQTATELIERISSAQVADADELQRVLRAEILSILTRQAHAAPALTAAPHVIMVVGVNGVGKTTTIGKLAARYSAAGKTVLIAAADTFRAAAGEQLEVWAERVGAPVVRGKDGSDPASVCFEAVKRGVEEKVDVVLLDTAGRLHTKLPLMEELKKVKRVVDKALPGAPHEVLLVLDATNGQNAIAQARQFHEALGVTGIALTKLDGTAKGGVVIGISDELRIPVRYVGVGEKVADLRAFDPEEFVDALFS